MKKIGILAVFLLFFWGIKIPVCAAGESVIPDMKVLDTQYDISEVQEEIQKLFPEYKIPVKEMFASILQGDFKSCFQEVKQGIWKMMTKEAAGMKKIFITILILSILSAVFTHLSDIFENYQVAEIGFYMVYLILVTILMTAFGEAAAIAAGLTENLLLFMKLFIPTYFCVIGMASGAMSAYAYYHLMLILIYAIEIVISVFVFPIVYSYIFLNIINGLWMEEKLAMLMEFLKKGIYLLLKVAITVVMGISFIQSMITPVIDSVKGAALQKAVSAIPGLGNMVSGVTEMMVGSAVLIKNGIGTLFMILLIMICAVPVIKLAIIAFMMKAAAAVSGIVADKRLTNCTDHMGDGGLMLLRSILTVAALFMITAAIVSYTTNRGF